MKNITRFLCAGTASLALILGLAGCAEDVQRGSYEGYAVENRSGNSLNYPSLRIYSKEKNGGDIHFIDKNKNSQFDKIIVNIVNPTDPLWQYANPNVGNRILDKMNSRE